MSLINVSNLTFAYDGSYDNVFDNVSFQLDTAWKLGFTGRNGRGKTTFLNLLMGKYEHQGSISASVDFEYFPYLPQNPGYLALDIAREACPGLEQWQLERELSLLDMEPDDVLYRPYGTLSNGEQTKIMLVALFLRDNAFLLIDEPTNHLDSAARQKVSQYLSRKSGFILVSHDRAFLDGCIDHVLSINRQDIVVQKGNFSSWMENKRMQDEYELAENERLAKDVKRLKSAARRTADWSDKLEASKIGSHSADRGFIGAQAARAMKRSKAIERRRENAADQKASLLKNIETAEPLKIHPLDFHARRLVSLEDVAISYDGRAVAQGITFDIEQGQQIALTGKNGSGKSSLLKLILGQKIKHTGAVYVAPGLKISYVSQQTDHLCGSLSDFCIENSLDESLFKAILHKLDFSRVQLEKEIQAYSQGQKKKVLLACSLCQSAHLYIWDEPLNYIDVLSRIQIEELLRQFRPTMLFVEHDISFVQGLADKIVQI